MKINFILYSCLLLTACSSGAYKHPPQNYQDHGPKEFKEWRDQLKRNENYEINHQLNSKNLSKKKANMYIGKKHSGGRSHGF